MADELYTEKIFKAKFEDRMSAPVERATNKVREAYDNLSRAIKEDVDNINSQKITLKSAAPRMIGGGLVGAGAGYLAGGPVGAGVGAGIGAMVGLLTKLVSIRSAATGKTEAEKREGAERGPLGKIASEITKLNNIIKGFIIGTIMAPALEELSIMMRTFLTPVGMFFRSIAQTLWPVVETIMPMWKDMWRDMSIAVVGFISRHIPDIIAFFTEWLPKSFDFMIAAWEKVIWPFLKGTAAELQEWVNVWNIYGWEGIKRLAVTRWSEFLKWWGDKAWPMITEVATKGWNELVKYLDTNFPNFTRRVRETWHAIVALWDAIVKPFLKGIGAELQEWVDVWDIYGLEGLKRLAVTRWGQFLKIADKAWNSFLDWWDKTAWPKITKVAGEQWDKFLEWWEQSGMKKFAGVIKDAWYGLIGWLDEEHPKFMEKAREVKQWFLDLVTFLGSISWDDVKDGFNTIMSALKWAGWAGLAAAVLSVIGTIATVTGGFTGLGAGIATFFTWVGGVIAATIGVVGGAVIGILLAAWQFWKMFKGETKDTLGAKYIGAPLAKWRLSKEKPVIEGLTAEGQAIVAENPQAFASLSKESDTALPPGIKDKIAVEEGNTSLASAGIDSRNATLKDILEALKTGFVETVDAIDDLGTDSDIDSILQVV